jgi:hypothetical protein
MNDRLLEDAGLQHEVSAPIRASDLEPLYHVHDRIARKSNCLSYPRCRWMLDRNYRNAHVRDAAIMAIGFRTKVFLVEKAEAGTSYI